MHAMARQSCFPVVCGSGKGACCGRQELGGPSQPTYWHWYPGWFQTWVPLSYPLCTLMLYSSASVASLWGCLTLSGLQCFSWNYLSVSRPDEEGGTQSYLTEKAPNLRVIIYLFLLLQVSHPSGVLLLPQPTCTTDPAILLQPILSTVNQATMRSVTILQESIWKAQV